jgi:hypothetical protein
MVDSIPSILETRFSRIDGELGHLREGQSATTNRIGALERRLMVLESKLDELPGIISKMLDQRLPRS